MLALAAALAIVVQDHTPLRSAAQSSATELTTLSQGDVLEVRGEHAGYLQVYNYRRERGGFLRSDTVRSLGLTATDAPELLAVLRFLRESRGSEALGISYGAAYLKAVPAQALTAEPLEAIAHMAERLADAAERLCLPDVDQRALEGLKFNEALPERLATATLAARLADLDSAAQVLAESARFTVLHEH